ncbi:TIGR03086 family metal-binding protein [Kitasatospora sp. CB02891]|uniref:TIGR03086 family metal-binding protein n=1 Tax=Kitasatospora sp. CB02891 TaxID=2020329 RepID=UPI000C26E60B|nr:TIGR03086 family metal-binding protein [Kitasatospora sp. CB02891]PJN29525.1 TIGR03086 family protein [Kitasatospora sp. CB02891]
MATHLDDQDLLALHAGALDHFGRLVRAVPDDRWQARTPCTDWTVRQLVGHLTYEQLWVPDLLAGATVAEVGDRYDGDVLGDDPVAAWTAAADAARAAFAEPGALRRTVHLSYGRRRAAGYCREMTVDAVVHGWDLATGIGADARMDPAAASFALAEIAPQAGALSASGLFADAVPVPADADPQDRLLGLVGRDPADPFGAN